ncbi:hypothetical protein BRC68_05375 [Halobacteriales archaeon QH_6_64_20]|nr:MAG: hypothetical protein BRC68_05375 [Halobacteriales archaeon QH_6_64_20]
MATIRLFQLGSESQLLCRLRSLSAIGTSTNDDIPTEQKRRHTDERATTTPAIRRVIEARETDLDI